jgi:XTP/dITP diphosphohydrolase
VGQKLWKIVPHCWIDKFTRDPIFQPEWFDKTYAELTIEEKNKISHRSKAFHKFEIFLLENE